MCYLVRSGQVGKRGGSAMLWKRGESTIISDRFEAHRLEFFRMLLWSIKSTLS